MKNLLAKFGFGEKLQRNFLAILIVAFSGAIIYGLPYFRYDYYDAYLATYNLTNTQMGVFGSILGVFGMISYLFGGVVADKFSTRTILTVSLVGTGIGGLIHLLPLSYGGLVCLYAFWGISSLFAFWPACIKAVRILSDSDSQGKAYGFFESGRGVGAALMSMGAVMAFRIGIGAINDEVLGMKYCIVYYSIITILMGVFCFFTVKEDIKSDEAKVSFKGIGEVIKQPAVWIIGIVTLCNYVFTMSLYYFTPYSTSLLGISVTTAAIIASAKRWLSLFGSAGGGFFTDKFGTSNALLISFIVMVVGVVGILLLPLNPSSAVLFTVLFFIVYIFYNVNYAETWAMMDEGAIPSHLSGTAAGLISTIGYLPEIFIAPIAGILVDNDPGVGGYRTFFGILIAFLLLGIVFVMIWKNYLKKKNLGK